MRIVGLLFATGLVGLLAAASARADDADFPYTAYANSDDVYIRSGPGKNYYPTEKLNRGEAVEIFRHDPGGWYAVRPPRGSFSWVPARLVRPTKDHLGVVNGDRVVSRVGSRFSDVRDVIQVRLDRGEEVEILEVKTISAGGQSEQWCKIAPPSGEFRWVFGKFVDPQPPAADRAMAVDDDRSATPAKPRSANRTVQQTAAAERQYSPDDPDAVAIEEEVAPPAPAKKPKPRRRARPTSDSDVTLTAGDSHAADATQPRAATNAAKPATPSREEAFQVEIDAVDLALSSMVVEEPSAWQFDDLEHRAETALDHAQTALRRRQSAAIARSAGQVRKHQTAI